MRKIGFALALIMLAGCAQLPEREPDRIKDRTVAYGDKVRISSHGRWKTGANNKCFEKRLYQVELVKRPAHGTVNVEPIRRKRKGCSNKLDMMGIFYTATPGYIGTDEFSYMRVNPDSGKKRLYQVNLKVQKDKPAKKKKNAKTEVGPKVVREIQLLLSQQGYDPGPPDGKVGPKTRTAIQSFQKKKGLQATGRPSPALLALLRAG